VLRNLGYSLKVKPKLKLKGRLERIVMDKNRVTSSLAIDCDLEGTQSRNVWITHENISL